MTQGKYYFVLGTLISRQDNKDQFDNELKSPLITDNDQTVAFYLIYLLLHTN